MALAQAQLLRISGAPVGFQSYWINATGRIDGDLYRFLPFDTGVITTTNTGDNETLSVELPASTEMFDLVEQSVAEQLVWIVSIVNLEALSNQGPGELIPGETFNDAQVYEFGSLSDGLVLVARFYGEVIGCGSDMGRLSVELGSSLSPVGSQVPPRKFSTSRVGAPLRL